MLNDLLAYLVWLSVLCFAVFLTVWSFGLV